MKVLIAMTLWVVLFSWLLEHNVGGAVALLAISGIYAINDAFN